MDRIEPTAEHLSVALDAVNAASENAANLAWYEKAIKPSLSLVKGQYGSLVNLWESAGWTTESTRVFNSMMDGAQSLAGDLWGQNSLDVRWAQVKSDIANAGEDSTPSAIDYGTDQVKQGAVKTVAAVKETVSNIASNVKNLVPAWLVPVIAVVAILYVLSWLPRAPSKREA